MWKKIILVVLCFVFIFFVGNIVIITKDYADAETEYENIAEMAVTKEDSETESKYKDINWDELLAINEDIVAWIYIPDTVIDYPIVQGVDNNQYLRTTVEGQNKTAGSIFMESANSSDFSDDNTIIYGHNMRNGTMFGGLNKFLNQEYATQHNNIQIYTPDWNATYHIYSVHVDINTGDSYNISPDNYKTWVNSMQSISNIKANDADENLHTITLSACYGKAGSSNRVVVQIQKASETQQEAQGAAK